MKLWWTRPVKSDEMREENFYGKTKNTYRLEMIPTAERVFAILKREGRPWQWCYRFMVIDILFTPILSYTFILSVSLCSSLLLPFRPTALRDFKALLVVVVVVVVVICQLNFS